MKKLLIYNNFPAHYEIIETIIVKYNEIFTKINNTETMEITLMIINNDSYVKYITSKYSHIYITNNSNINNINSYDYYIYCTIYDKDYNLIDTSCNNKFYISHEITERLKYLDNVYFLTPLSQCRYFFCDILPFNENKIYTKKPIYIVQGSINDSRRNYHLLIKLLENNSEKDFIIKIIGNNHGALPSELLKYKDKIIIKTNLNFIDFHKEFLDVYCIIPLITKKSHKDYYSKKLTSSINYAKAYNLKCLIDEDLQNIYNLENVEIFKDINNISLAFNNTYYNFYKMKHY